MLRAAAIFPIFGNAAKRMADSMVKYLPDDVELVDVPHWDSEIQSNNVNIVIGHVGHGMNHPQWAYVSPKALISERDDDVFLSWMTDRDIVFTYRPDRLEYIWSKGVRAVSWPRPVDPEIFYREYVEYQFDVFTSGVHNDWPQRTHRVLESLGMRHMIIEKEPIDGIAAVYDFCQPGSGDDRLRYYYSCSRFHMSLVSEYEYFPGFTNCGIETGNAEAAFCGCPSIILDQPGSEYLKHWYGDSCGIFVKPENFESELKTVLRGHDGVDIDAVKAKFSAPIVWDQFWQVVKELTWQLWKVWV